MMTDTTLPPRLRYEETDASHLANGYAWRYEAHAPNGRYTSNKEGQGLFWIPAGQMPRQLTGTSQFSVGNLDQFRRKLRAWLRGAS